MICDNSLKYLEVGREFTCIKCGNKEKGYVVCPNGHYVCDNCHGKTAFELVIKMALDSKELNPLVIAEEMIEQTNIPMLGCEHAWIAAGALISALKNHGHLHITPAQIEDAIHRTKKQAISAYCGLTGVCGIAPAIGAVFSVVLGASCPKDWETATTMHVVAQIVEAIAGQAGPSCCKNYTRTALTLACKLADKHLQVQLPTEIELTCKDAHRHPHGCRRERCAYNPAS